MGFSWHLGSMSLNLISTGPSGQVVVRVLEGSTLSGPILSPLLAWDRSLYTPERTGGGKTATFCRQVEGFSREAPPPRLRMCPNLTVDTMALFTVMATADLQAVSVLGSQGFLSPPFLP